MTPDPTPTEARERLEQLARRTIGCISRSCHDTAVTDAILATIDALEALGFVRRERLEVSGGSPMNADIARCVACGGTQRVLVRWPQEHMFRLVRHRDGKGYLCSNPTQYDAGAALLPDPEVAP